MDGSAPTSEPSVNVPPHDAAAEQAVLSALFLDPTITVELEPDHFYFDANAWVYRAVRAVGPDPVLTAHWLRDQQRLGQVGGQPYLLTLIDGYPKVATTQAAATAYAAIVRECFRRRVLIAAFQRCTAELYAGSLSAGDAWRRMKECCDVC